MAVAVGKGIGHANSAYEYSTDHIVKHALQKTADKLNIYSAGCTFYLAWKSTYVPGCIAEISNLSIICEGCSYSYFYETFFTFTLANLSLQMYIDDMCYHII